MTDTASASYGVHSEVGRLRKVLVCSPGLAHERLTPTNCDDLLFDDVLWVQNARRDHFDFVDKMRDRGVEVVELHEVLAETMDDPRGAGLAARPQDHRQRGRHRSRRRDTGVPRRARLRNAGAVPDRRSVDPRPARGVPSRVPRTGA